MQTRARALPHSLARSLACSFVFLMAAGPAFAGQSSPAERDATRQLNLEAARMAKAATNSAPDNSGIALNSPPAAAPTTPVQSAAIASAGMAAPVTLSSFRNPPGKVANANVLDVHGQTIGAVQQVEVTPDGTPTRVAVALLGTNEKMVVLDAHAVTYDPRKNEITTPQSGEELKSRTNAG